MVVIITAFLMSAMSGGQAAPQLLSYKTSEDASRGGKVLAGKIVFEDTFFDFGKVIEGEVVSHVFRFRNEGEGTVTITGIETSCGCTTTKGILKEYQPGQTGTMAVDVDTKGKKGIVVKTISLKLENNELAKLQVALSMKLEPPPHPAFESARNINTESACKGCHLESGVGQKGIFLYHRICAQCHGKKGKGSSARALSDAEWQKVDDEYLRHWIRFGDAKIGMPSYVEGVSPALTDEQVDSLVTYIRSLAPIGNQ